MTSENLTPPADLSRLKTITLIVYLLQAVGLLFAFPFVIAIMINYIKRDDVQGTWLASHFRWQIRTFWYSLPWFIVGFLTYWLIIGWIMIGVVAMWVIYRILKGWLNLYDLKSMYASESPPT